MFNQAPSARYNTSARSSALGDALVHRTWPHHPGVQALERAGHLVADATDRQLLLSANPADAITLLRLALAQNLTP